MYIGYIQNIPIAIHNLERSGQILPLKLFTRATFVQKFGLGQIVSNPRFTSKAWKFFSF